MEFLTMFKEAKSLGLTKDDFIGIWKIESEISLQKKGQSSTETSIQERQQTRSDDVDGSVTDQIMQIKTTVDVLKQESKQDTNINIQNICQQLMEKQEQSWQQMQLKHDKMIEEFRSSFEILSKHVTTIADLNERSVKLYFMQELELLKQELGKVIKEEIKVNRSSGNFQSEISIQHTQLSNAQHTQLSNAQQTQLSNAQHTPLSNAQQTQLSNAQQTQLSNAQQTQLSKTQQTQLSNAQQTQLTNAQQTQLSNAQQTQLSNAQQTQLTNAQQTHLSKTQQTQLSNVQQTQLTNAQQAQLTNAQQTQLTNAQQTHLSKTQQIQLTNAQQTQLTNAQQTQLSNAQQTQLSNAQQTQFSKTQQTQLSNAQQTQLTNAQQTNAQQTHLSKTQQTQLSNAQQTQLINTQQTQLSNAQQTQLSNAQQTQLTNAQQTQLSNAQQTQFSKTQQTQLSNAQQTQLTNAQQTNAQQTNAQQTHLSKTQQTQLSNAQQTQLINTQQTQLSNAQQTQLSDAHQTQFSKTQQTQLSNAQQTQLTNAQQTQLSNAQQTQLSNAQQTQLSDAQQTQFSKTQQTQLSNAQQTQLTNAQQTNAQQTHLSKTQQIQLTNVQDKTVYPKVPAKDGSNNNRSDPVKNSIKDTQCNTTANISVQHALILQQQKLQNINKMETVDKQDMFVEGQGLTSRHTSSVTKVSQNETARKQIHADNGEMESKNLRTQQGSVSRITTSSGNGSTGGSDEVAGFSSDDTGNGKALPFSQTNSSSSLANSQKSESLKIENKAIKGDDSQLIWLKMNDIHDVTISDTVGTFLSPFMYPSGKACLARVQTTFEETGHLTVSVLVEKGPYDDHYKWPLLLSGKGYIYNKGSSLFTQIWHLETTRCRKPPSINGYAKMNCVTRLMTSRRKEQNVTYNLLMEKNFIHDNSIRFKYSLQAIEIPA